MTMIAALGILLFLALSIRFGFTVVRIADEEIAVLSEAFDPVAYVDGIWEPRLIPAFNERSVELEKVLNEVITDAEQKVSKESLIDITEQYGLITVGEAHVYMVKGTGRVVNVNTQTSLGTIEVALDGYNGPIKVLLYVGPRIPSDDTSVRDSVGFINFGDFKEQTEYGKVASEINKRVLSQVLGKIDKDNLMGKSVTFQGAFNIRTFNLINIELADIRIVPVKMDVGD
jgi:predicted lipoprotein